MSKGRLNLTVDFDVAMYYRLRPEINISRLVNEVLKNNMNLQKNNKGEQEVEELLKKEEERIKEAQDKRNTLFLQLKQLKDERAEAERLEQVEIDRLDRSLRANNPLRYI